MRSPVRGLRGRSCRSESRSRFDARHLHWICCFESPVELSAVQDDDDESEPMTIATSSRARRSEGR